jgi:uncharacterized protein (TIRG00374 family)
MRRWIVWVPISAVLLGLLVWRTRPWEVLSIAGIQAAPILAVVVLNVVVIGGWTFRSAWLMATIGHPMRIRDVVPLVAFANTINNLTPASSGEVARAVLLQRIHSVPIAAASAVIIAERVWAIWIMAVSAAAAIVGGLLTHSPVLVGGAWLAAVILAFAPRLAYLRNWQPGRRAGRVVAWRSGGGFRARLGSLMGRVDDNLATVVRSPRASGEFVATTALVFVVTAVQLSLLLASLGIAMPLMGAWAALGTATIAGVLSALPFGLGAADVVLVAMLGLLGVDPAQGGAVALLWRATVTLPLGLAGTASWIVLSRTSSAGSYGGPTAG